MKRFGSHSLSELQSVRAELVIAATETLIFVGKAELDFSVFDGMRSRAEQRKNIRRGVSWTMNSMHLPQADGLSWAVDLVPYINGRLTWDSPDPNTQKVLDRCFALINLGMRSSAKKHGFIIEWGYYLWGKDKPHFQYRR